MSKYTLALFACVFLTLQGCYAAPGPGGQGGKKDRKWEPQFSDNLFGIDALKTACAASHGAYFSDKTLECFCSQDEQTPRIFSAMNGCVPLDYKNPICQSGWSAKDGYLNGWIPELNKCLEGVVRHQRTSLTIELARSVAGSDALAIARYADRDLLGTFVKLWSTSEELYFNSSVRIFVGKSHVGRDFVEQVIAPPPVTAQQRYRSTFIEPDPKALLHTLGHPNSNIPSPAEVHVEIVRQFPIATFIGKVASQIIRDGYSDRIYRVGGDCRSYCLVEKVVADNAIRSRAYMAGVPFRDIITINDRKSGEPIAFVQLNLSGGVSSILFVKRDYDPRLDLVYATVTVYDRLWNMIGKETISLLEQVSHVADLVSRMDEARQPIKNGIVLCETVDVEVFVADRIPLVRGNSRADLLIKTGSFLGWLSNPTGSIQRLLDAVVEAKEGIIPSPDALTHGLRVAKTILSQNRNVVLVPISMPNCMKAYSDWAPRVERYGAKVINLSGTEAVDLDWCKTFLQPDTFLGSNKPFLWIVPAGNSGTQNPKLRCPQNIRSTPNLIVVAGGSRQGIWQNSDYGKDYADIVADISTPSSHDIGTSYSAARVSAVAAELAALFPALTPSDLRIALLAGSDVPNYPLEVRSGGALDRDLALTVGDALSKMPAEARRSLDYSTLQKILSLRLSAAASSRRAQLLKERRLLK